MLVFGQHKKKPGAKTIKTPKSLQSEKCEIHCVIYGSEKLRED